jgi:hypothetical protein
LPKAARRAKPAGRQASQIEGGIWIQGRHNRGAGFITDIEKYNEATFCGWRVFRLADVHPTLEVVGRVKERVVGLQIESLRLKLPRQKSDKRVATWNSSEGN